MKKKISKQKKVWKRLEMTRVKLNPEQAVLSCCDATLRMAISESLQCWDGVCGPMTNPVEAASS